MVDRIFCNTNRDTEDEYTYHHNFLYILLYMILLRNEAHLQNACNFSWGIAQVCEISLPFARFHSIFFFFKSD